MRRIFWFVLGMLVLAVVLGLGGIVFAKTARGFSASAKPSGVEAWIAEQVRAMAMPSDARSRANPVPDSPEAIAQGRSHFADHCAICHANNGSGESEIGRHLYPPAPDMRKPSTQDMSDGEIFFIIQNGIRLSGMPAWGEAGHGEEDSWRLVRFIRHLPKLSAEEEREMEKLNPKGPDEHKEGEEHAHHH